ncbi:MAG: DMT family transporter [Prevotella sp.]|nr:DMT family transporter [Prevotella sp.]MCM1074407.1 DMT family transporter [Ruminococcus sp.]
MTKTNKPIPNTSLKLLAHIGAIVTISCWGTSFVSTKVLMENGGFTPVEMFVYRFAVAYLLLLLLTCNKSLMSHNWKDELCFVACGVCAGSLYFITENFALRNTTASNVSLLASISPIFTTLLCGVFYKMKINGGVIIGSVIAFVGVGFVVFSGSADGLEIHPIGDTLALSAALSWGLYSIVVKRLIPIYNSFFITRKLFLYGVLTGLPVLFMQTEPYHLAELIDFGHPEYILNFAFLVIMCSVVSYLIWNETMKILGSVTANNYLYGQPIVTMIIGVSALGEPLTVLGCVGCVLIIGGLIVSDKLDLSRLRRA